MGMAASQARFLGLTARKTNVEYEGQQVNQQRTTLSNTTANYYNDLLGMSVPVPPSVDDYTKTVYSFKDGALTNSISSMIAQNNGLYKVSYTSQWVDDFSAIAAPTAIVTKNNGEYMVGAKTLRIMGQPLNRYKATDYDASGNKVGNPTTVYFYNGDNKYYITKGEETCDTYNIVDTNNEVIASKLYKNTSDNKYYYNYDPTTGEYTDEYQVPTGASVQNGNQAKLVKYSNEYTRSASAVNTRYEIDYNDEYLETLSTDQITKLQQEEAAYIQILIDQYGGDEKDWEVRYVENTTSKTWQPFFCKKSVLDAAIYSDNGASLSYIDMYTIGSKTKTEEVKQVDARFEQDSTGRIINITLHPGQDDQVTYAVSTETVTDQAKYDDAMNQYEYDKAQYDQAIQEINAKIEIIQSEDRNLELRLKQLDTEQEAIQTEMEAVEKIIEKNTESTFKTFG